MATDKVAKMIDEFRQDMKREFREFSRDIRKELVEVKASLDFFNTQFEELKAAVSSMQKENTTLKEECAILKKEVKECQTRLIESEQYSRNKNLEIKGLKAEADENLMQVLNRLGERVGEPIDSNDVEVIHRVPQRKNDTDKNVIVQFVWRTKRDVVLQKSRKLRLSCTDFDVSSSAPVFINEHLCPDLKRLLGKTVKRRREHGWKFSWTKNGRIFVRKSELSPTIHVKDEDDLAKIC